MFFSIVLGREQSKQINNPEFYFAAPGFIDFILEFYRILEWFGTQELSITLFDSPSFNWMKYFI